MRIFTIGHSTRAIEDFVALCRAHGVGEIVDVRRFPGSRRHPQFGRERLGAALADAGIGYTWLPGLGGRRSRRADSPHTAWRVAAFGGYADHMETEEFAVDAGRLIERARAGVVAVMCAEAHPSQCHRRLIADWLVARGVDVVHIVGPGRAEPHALTPWARVDGDRIVYDVGDEVDA